MPCICYVDRQFSTSTMEVIDKANRIVEEYLAQGFRLTLRQLYYQFVARGWLANRQQNYKRLGSILGDARNAGLIDWSAIEDRTRELRSKPHWDSPADILESCAAQFRFDLWKDQPYRVEVWIEKDALLGVFEPTCVELDAPLFSCRGYTSQSEVWEAGRRLLSHLEAGQSPVILHFGDHDPSGMDMTRDITERLGLYAEEPIEVERLALNYDQVQQYSPPSNPAKVTDSRYAKYVEVHGEESWELDALEPNVIAELIRSTVLSYRDESLWEDAMKRQQAARDRLRELAENWGGS
jgi:hypothetical protein